MTTVLVLETTFKLIIPVIYMYGCGRYLNWFVAHLWCTFKCISKFFSDAIVFELLLDPASGPMDSEDSMNAVAPSLLADLLDNTCHS